MTVTYCKPGQMANIFTDAGTRKGIWISNIKFFPASNNIINVQRKLLIRH